jgi:hypothetical protein
MEHLLLFSLSVSLSLSLSFTVLGVEFRASTTEATPPALFELVVFEMRFSLHAYTTTLLLYFPL